jgi:6-phosphofructokinase 1
MMAALREGKYTVVPIDTILQGRKVVDVTELYDSENYRPRISRMLDKPMFLY